MRRIKPIDQSKRPVPGGFIQRTNLGDRWAWLCMGEDGEPRAVLASDLHPLIRLAMLGRLAPHLWHGSEDD